MDKVVKWYEKNGTESDVVRSTRIRLARNLKSYPFPKMLSSEQKEEVEEKVKNAFMSGNSVMKDQFDFIKLDKMSTEQIISLVEQHAISPEFASDISGRALLISKDEGISIMINEEDHLRIQVIEEGLELHKAYETIDRIDTLLNESLDFAFDKELGFLTRCPTNLGTGMRASVMLHLPALTEQGAMNRMTSNLSKLGIIVRGTYGEGTNVVGSLYQFSNQITLGLSEKEAIENLRSIVKQLINEERSARKAMVESIEVQDKISRSAGILKNSKILSTNELMKLASYVRLGVTSGFLTGISEKEVDSLISKTQPATLMADSNKKMTQKERDIQRAETARRICGEIREL